MLKALEKEIDETWQRLLRMPFNQANLVLDTLGVRLKWWAGREDRKLLARAPQMNANVDPNDITQNEFRRMLKGAWGLWPQHDIRPDARASKKKPRRSRRSSRGKR